MNRRELLEQPFRPEQIKQRQGSFGQTLDYVSGYTVIERLNEAFESQWSFEIIHPWTKGAGKENSGKMDILFVLLVMKKRQT